MAQSRLVAKQLEQKNPNLQIQLVPMETKGDKILDVPLREVEGKEFFVAEIDQALLSKKTDISVHSFKDLSLERPDNIMLAATPPRANPRDIIIFNHNVVDKLKNNEPIIIGTSSPRRLENVPSFLKEALPQFGNTPKLEFAEIRGNVNTRLSKIHQDKSSDKYLDGVVLALAGLIRLWQDKEGQDSLIPLLKNTKKMLLPLTLNPTAPAQGILAVECRKDDPDTTKYIQSIHDEETFFLAKQERKVLSDLGGGCHCRFGVTSVVHPLLGKIQFRKGKDNQGNNIDDFLWQQPTASIVSTNLDQDPSIDTRNKKTTKKTVEKTMWENCFNGKKITPQKTEIPLPHEVFTAPPSSHVFIAHHRAYDQRFNWEQESLSNEQEPLSILSIWTSGTKSWFELSKKGLWIEGCAEGLGIDNLINITQEDTFWQFPNFSDWTIMTNEEAAESWDNKHILTPYKVDYLIDDELIASIKRSSFCYWSSIQQFQKLHSYCRAEVHHACGPGKTAQYLDNSKGSRNSKYNNIKYLDIFPNVEEWQKWIHNMAR